jgi:hypothetical protein
MTQVRNELPDISGLCSFPFYTVRRHPVGAAPTRPPTSQLNARDRAGISRYVPVLALGSGDLDGQELALIERVVFRRLR